MHGMTYVEQMFDIADRVIIITGGGGAIATAMSEGLLKAGAKVALWDVAQDALDGTRDKLLKFCEGEDRLFCVKTDATNEDSVEGALKETEERLGAPNVLINAAGGNRGKGPFVETDLSQFESILRLNLVAGLMGPTKVVAAYWIRNEIRGAVVNMASMNSYLPLSGIWAYSAAKAGVLNLTQAAAKEFAPYGIRVNAIAPGFFVGKQNKALLIKNEVTGELTDRGTSIIDRTPFGRFGDVSELIGVTVFLISEKASGFVTGVSIPVDGGYLIDNI